MSFGVNSEQLSEATHQRLRIYCMDAQARRNHSKHELITKMTSRGADSNLAFEVVDQLAKENLQSDKDFIESKLNSALRQGHGPARFVQSLDQHQLPSDLVQKVIEEISPDWYALAKQVYLKKYANKCLDGLSHEAVFKEKAKQSRFLFSRGFSSDQIKYAINQSE